MNFCFFFFLKPTRSFFLRFPFLLFRINCFGEVLIRVFSSHSLSLILNPKVSKTIKKIFFTFFYVFQISIRFSHLGV